MMPGWRYLGYTNDGNSVTRIKALLKSLLMGVGVVHDTEEGTVTQSVSAWICPGCPQMTRELPRTLSG